MAAVAKQRMKRIADVTDAMRRKRWNRRSA